MTIATSPPPLPPRPLDGHKGLFGRVLVVGGSDDMVGAPVLAGTAALRMGSGLVQIAVPRAVLPAALSITPELTGLGLEKRTAKKRLMEACAAADVIVLGPGLGQSEEAVGRVMRLIRLDKPMVIDADALNILAMQKKWPATFNAQAVLTPHPGEMARLGKLLGRVLPSPGTPGEGRVRAQGQLSSDESRIEIAAEASRTFGQVVVLKGHRTVVTDGSRVYVNTTGDSTLAKAGSGDVLSGIIGSLIGQALGAGGKWGGKPHPTGLFNAAVAGVWLHGRAGEIAGGMMGQRCALSRDVIAALPAAVEEYERRYFA